MLPASATDALARPAGASSSPAGLGRVCSRCSFAGEQLGVVGHRRAAMRLHDDQQRLGVISLAGQEPLGGALERGGRGEVGLGAELRPLRRLGPQVGVDLRAQSRADAAVEREKAGRHAERGDERRSPAPAACADLREAGA